MCRASAYHCPARSRFPPTFSAWAPIGRLRKEIRLYAARYRIPLRALRPWHYSDPFFQEAPRTGAVDLDALFSDQDVLELATRTFDGIGLEVRDILARSDLFERENKDQHAFCTHIDRASDDVRVLCNLRPDARWMNTMLHELGHAVYDKYLAADLPFLLRTAAHTNTTEAIAMLMGRLGSDDRRSTYRAESARTALRNSGVVKADRCRCCSASSH